MIEESESVNMKSDKGYIRKPCGENNKGAACEHRLATNMGFGLVVLSRIFLCYRLGIWGLEGYCLFHCSFL